MSQYVHAPTRQFAASGALGQFLRVYVTSGQIALAGATTAMVGTLERPAFAAADIVPVRVRNAEGTRIMIASEAITAGNYVYAAASGKVAADGSIAEGIALTAATADGDQIEVLVTGAGGGGGSGLIAAAQQALSGAGAVDVVSFYTAVTTTGADALTLANGTFPGQLKKIKMIVDGGDGTLTPTSFTNGTTITFADVGDYALLLWDGDSWTAIEIGNDTDGATAPVIA